MYKIQIRYVQTILLLLNGAVLYLNRLHIAVTILAMMKNSETEISGSFMTFDWNESQKSLILSSFYWGYTLGQIPSGFLVRRYNAKITLFVTTFISGIISLLIPFCVPWGDWKSFCLLRALQGLFQSCHYAACQQHLTKWAPIHERSLLTGISAAGYNFGSASAMLLGGLIAVSSLGWPGTFYISAATSFIYCFIWLLLGANDFNSSKFITESESCYIETSLQHSIDFEAKTLPIPWRKIFKSSSFLSTVISRITHISSYNVLVYYMPTYLQSVFHVKMHENAFYSAMPYIIQVLFLYFFLCLGELVIRRKLLTLTKLRKSFDAFGAWLPAALILYMAFLEEHQKGLAIILFVLLMCLGTATILGSHVNIIDIAPNYITILVTLLNTGTNFFVMLGPLCIGLIVNDVKNRNQWRLAFFMIAFIICIGNIVFLVWGSSEEEAWNSNKIKEESPVKIQETSMNNISKTVERTNQAFSKDL